MFRYIFDISYYFTDTIKIISISSLHFVLLYLWDIISFCIKVTDAKKSITETNEIDIKTTETTRTDVTTNENSFTIKIKPENDDKTTIRPELTTLDKPRSSMLTVWEIKRGSKASAT